MSEVLEPRNGYFNRGSDQSQPAHGIGWVCGWLLKPGMGQNGSGKFRSIPPTNYGIVPCSRDHNVTTL